MARFDRKRWRRLHEILYLYRRRRARLQGGGGSPPAVVALDPPITTALAAKTIEAWSAYRLVEGYSGNSFNAKNNDNAATANYGFDSNGRPIVDTLPSNADLVHFIGQKGSGINLAAVAGSATVALSRAGVKPRLGTTSGADEQLTRRTDAGAIGVDLAATGMLQTSALPVTLSTTGYELHILWSPNNRKRASNDATDTLTSDNVRENICCYGTNSLNQMIAYMGGGTATDFCRMQAGGQQNQTTGKQSQSTYRFKAKAQYVTSYVMGSAGFKEIEHGAVTKSVTLHADTTTAIAGGSMNNGVIGIGGVFSSTTTTALSTSNKGNIVFVAAILTEALTDAERFMVQAKLAAIGQEHLVRSVDDVEAMFDEIVDMRDANPATGRVVGRNGLLTVDFNTSAFTFASAVTNIGLTGVRSPDNATTNSFQATDNWFHDCLTGTVARIGFLESGAQNNSLQFDFGMSEGNPQSDTSDAASLLFGFHHTTPALGTKPADNVDTLPRLGTRRRQDLTQFGQTIYDGSNQTIGKYNWFISNIRRVLGETISSYVWGAPAWENTDGSAPYQLDAPVPQHTAENLSYPYKQSQLQLHIGTFEKPAAYNSASPDASLFLTAHNQSFVSGGAIQPIGHMDGSIATLDHAGVRHANTNHRIQSVPYQYQWFGTRCLWAFKKDEAFTQADAEVVQVNAYKLVA